MKDILYGITITIIVTVAVIMVLLVFIGAILISTTEGVIIYKEMVVFENKISYHAQTDAWLFLDTNHLVTEEVYNIIQPGKFCVVWDKQDNIYTKADCK